MNFKKTVAAVLAAMMLVATTACNSAKPVSQSSTQPDANSQVEATEVPKTVETFIVGTTAEIKSANRSEYNFDVISGTLSQLAPVWQDANGDFQPLLCDYKTTDSKTWTLTVRENMTWHDETPVTADDIKFTLEYLDTQTEGGYASSYADIRVLDNRTIELELPTPNPRQLSNLITLRIMPKHIYEGVKDYTTVPNEKANIGCGPYRFQRFDAQAGIIEFAAYEAYPDGKPTATTVVVKLYNSEDTMYMALQTGEIDLVYKYSGGVNPTVIEHLEKVENITLMPVNNTANSAVLIFNNSSEPFININIRKAVAAAIDYDSFQKLFGTPYATSANTGFIPKGSYGYIDTPVNARNLEQAKTYLKEAGCTDSDGDGFVEYQGKKLVVPVMLRGDKPAHTRYAELLKNNLAEVGIEVTLDVQEVANFRELTEKKRAQTAVITGLTAFGMAKNEGMAALYLWAENAMSYGQVADTAYKALLDKASAAASMEEYKLVAGEIQKYYAETIPAVALFWDAHVQAFNSKYDGFVVDSTFGIMNVQTWMNLTVKA